MINLYNMDCMHMMSSFKDNQFELAIVDPPYFSGPEKKKYYGKPISNSKHSKTGVIQRVNRTAYPVSKEWTVPNKLYFNELLRVSKHQIIWGINYFPDAPKFPGRIVWDKVNGKSFFSDCELAACSIHDSVRIVSYMWNGMMQGKSIEEGRIQQGNKKLNEKRIHPTQKPVKLYEWLLSKYANPGDLVLDTHVGSGSLPIACINLGFDFVGCELDEIHYKATQKRLSEITS